LIQRRKLHAVRFHVRDNARSWEWRIWAS